MPTFYTEVRKEVKNPDFHKHIIIIYLLRSKLQKTKTKEEQKSTWSSETGMHYIIPALCRCIIYIYIKDV